MSTQGGGVFMDSMVIQKLLDPEIHRPLQIITLIILVLNFPQNIIQKLSRQLLQLSALDRILFANAVEEFDRRMIPELYMDINSSHQVLE